MLRSKLETLKIIFTSGYWLIASLVGAFFSFFALNRGGVVVFIEIGACFVFINVLTGEYKLKQIPQIYWYLLGICVYLVVSSYLLSTHQVRSKTIMYLIRMLFIVFSIHCLSLKKIDSHVFELLPILWCLSVGLQFVAVKFFNLPFGTYGNPHYLSNFMISILPLIVYSFWVAKSWYKWIFILFALLAIDMLLRTGSRPAILGLTFSSLFILVFFIKSRIRWIGFLAIVLSFGFLFITNYGGVASHLEELIFNLRSDDRVDFWKSALQMLEKNNTIDWIFGNGIGGYRAIYADYSAAPELKRYFFPHLHPLGILYDNGIIGVILVFGGFTALFVLTVKAMINSLSKNISLLIKCMLVIFLCWMIHSSLTFPFYSKYAQYPLGFILGTMLVLLDQCRFTKQERPIL
jgi:hypothetical protein